MYRNIKTGVCIIMVLTLSFLFSGCTFVDNMKVKAGLKNVDFDYIKQGRVQKIVIQNTRDRGYRFIVTDKRAIQDLYDILSSAKAVNEKSTLEPDYIFEMYEDHNNVHKFNYVAGLDKKDGGNLYSDDKIYLVSARIDNDIIKSFWNIRRPKDFRTVYYGSIIKTLNEYNKYLQTTNSKIPGSIGINLKDDVDAAKFILSADLEEFKGNLEDKYKTASLITGDNKDKYDALMTVKTQGYKLTLYKSMIIFNNNLDKSEKKFYVKYENLNGRWEVNIYDDSNKPDDF